MHHFLRGVDLSQIWFQQDGATCHTAGATLRWLQSVFNDRLISKKCDVEWGPRSPDMNPLDFFLWGFLKDRVYEGNPETLDQLKRNITREVRAISPAIRERVTNNFKKRLDACLKAKGRHMEHRPL